MSQHELLTRKRRDAMHSKQQQLKKAERAWYRAKARAEQAADLVSDCQRKVARLREDLDCEEVRGGTPLQIRKRKQKAKKLKGILIEVNGGVVSYVQFNGKP